MRLRFFLCFALQWIWAAQPAVVIAILDIQTRDVHVNVIRKLLQRTPTPRAEFQQWCPSRHKDPLHHMPWWRRCHQTHIGDRIARFFFSFLASSPVWGCFVLTRHIYPTDRERGTWVVYYSYFDYCLAVILFNRLKSHTRNMLPMDSFLLVNVTPQTYDTLQYCMTIRQLDSCRDNSWIIRSNIYGKDSTELPMEPAVVVGRK